MYKAIHYLDKPFEKMPIINFFDTIILQRNFYYYYDYFILFHNYCARYKYKEYT